MLRAAADAVERRVEQIAQDMTLEMGKPLREARMRGRAQAQILRFFAGEAWRPKGELFEQSVDRQRRLHDPAAARRRRR